MMVLLGDLVQAGNLKLLMTSIEQKESEKIPCCSSVSRPVVRPPVRTHARFVKNGHLRTKHGRGRHNDIEMISQGLLNESSLFRHIMLCAI